MCSAEPILRLLVYCCRQTETFAIATFWMQNPLARRKPNPGPRAACRHSVHLSLRDTPPILFFSRDFVAILIPFGGILVDAAQGGLATSLETSVIQLGAIYDFNILQRPNIRIRWRLKIHDEQLIHAMNVVEG